MLSGNKGRYSHQRNQRDDSHFSATHNFIFPPAMVLRSGRTSCHFLPTKIPDGINAGWRHRENSNLVRVRRRILPLNPLATLICI